MRKYGIVWKLAGVVEYLEGEVGGLYQPHNGDED
jgi:hypothetical protein